VKKPKAAPIVHLSDPRVPDKLRPIPPRDDWNGKFAAPIALKRLTVAVCGSLLHGPMHPISEIDGEVGSIELGF
jgi:hypothetical protein